ncbi:MAG: hypothetical protein IKL52_07450, partial [Candidatus Gastranaerophilales bacterium]|nr:hypothetical protein [Candidatus Gastranaerophilales bacterium]
YACNLWVLISCAFLLINKKKYQHLIVFIFPFFLVLTVLFSPTALLRYVYYNYLILPVVLALTFSKFKND